MTYQELLIDLHTAERDTEALEAYVAARLAKEIARWGPELVEAAETNMESATFFIHDMEKASWAQTDDSPASQCGTQNAFDTVEDYGVEADSLVGKFIFACTNFPVEGV